MKHLGMTALAILLIISTSAWSAPPLTAEQKTLVVSITISGQPYGDVQSANGRMGTMNQCRLFPNSSNPRSEPLFVSGSGVGYGGYCCLIRPEIAHMKGYSLGDLPYAVYGRALRCVVDESLRRTGGGPTSSAKSKKSKTTSNTRIPTGASAATRRPSPSPPGPRSPLKSMTSPPVARSTS